MSYMGAPSGTRIVANSTGNNVQMEMQFDYEDTPHKIDEFLKKLGWTEHFSNHPDTQATVYQKVNDTETENMYFSWAEAMAYVWYRMLTLGGA